MGSNSFKKNKKRSRDDRGQISRTQSTDGPECVSSTEPVPYCFPSHREVTVIDVDDDEESAEVKPSAQIGAGTDAEKVKNQYPKVKIKRSANGVSDTTATLDTKSSINEMDIKTSVAETEVNKTEEHAHVIDLSEGEDVSERLTTNEDSQTTRSHKKRKRSNVPLIETSPVGSSYEPGLVPPYNTSLEPRALRKLVRPTQKLSESILRQKWDIIEKESETKEQRIQNSRGRYFASAFDESSAPPLPGILNIDAFNRPHAIGRRTLKVCIFCGDTDHSIKECPQGLGLCIHCCSPYHNSGECPDSHLECRTCRRHGHTADSVSACPKMWISHSINNTYAFPPGIGVTCIVCHKDGHYFCGAMPPHKDSRFETCANCGGGGHGIDTCAGRGVRISKQRKYVRTG